jgi:hypothetical protein
MILHRLLRQTKPTRNFLVGRPNSDQWNQLLLPARQTQLLPHRSRRQTRRPALKIIERQSAQRAPACTASNASHPSLGQAPIRTPNPSAHVLKKVPLSTGATEHHNAHLWRTMRTLRMLEISLLRFPRDVSNSTSGEFSGIRSTRNISLASPARISSPARFVSTTTLPKERKNLFSISQSLLRLGLMFSNSQTATPQSPTPVPSSRFGAGLLSPAHRHQFFC